MSGSSNSNSKPRQPRLRASCDGCFLAKVKCSKARPICSRCLACGIECRYSPSTRAGKPKSEHSTNHHHHHHHQGSSASDMSGLSPVADDKSMMFTTHVGAPDLYRLDTGWNTRPTAVDGGPMSRNHSLSSGLALLGVDERAAREAEAVAAGAVADMYGAGMPWTPPNDLSGSVHFPPEASPDLVASMSQQGIPHHPHPPHHPHHARSHSFDVAMAANVSSWADPSGAGPHDLFTYGGPTHMPTPASMANYFPSPSSTPTLRPQPRSGKAPSTGSNGGGSVQGGSGSSSCTCFTACLQSLQALHNASSPGSPPFDVVLSLNRKAVEGCAAMLGCPRCMSRSGTHTAAMLLATVIGKITSFYKHASQTYFESGPTGVSGSTGSTSPSLSLNESMSSSISSGMGSGINGTMVGGLSGMNGMAGMGGVNGMRAMNGMGGAVVGGLGVSLGAYQVGGEDGRWIELEILARELRKLEEVYGRFREVFADLSEDAEISKAMIGYLGQTLDSTLEVVSHRKGDMAFT